MTVPRTWQQEERLRRRYEHRREVLLKTFEDLREAVRPFMDAMHRHMDQISRSPAFLDLWMINGVYEEHLAESHGDVEDVFT